MISIERLKNLQQERIKPKFNDEEIENRIIDWEIKKLTFLYLFEIIHTCIFYFRLFQIKNKQRKFNIKNDGKKKFCEVLTKMEKIKNNISLSAFWILQLSRK